MNRDRLLILRDLIIILIVIGAGLLYFQPALRNRVVAMLPTDVRVSGERATRWVVEHLPWNRPAPKTLPTQPETPSPPAPQPEGPTKQTEGEVSPTPPAEVEPEPEVPPKAAKPPAPAVEHVEPGGNLAPRLPDFRTEPPLPGNLKALRAAAASFPSAAALRKLADAAVAAGFPSIASEAYQKEAAIYRSKGDENAAAVESLKAARYRAEGILYLHQPQNAEPSASLARLEPSEGVLVGAFIDRDERLPTTFFDENWQTHRDPGEFAELTGKKPASLFCYLSYGKPFPMQWAERLKAQGVIPHLAWEPKRLADVAEGEYLNRFAADVARLDYPVFLRFAGEMNGEWVPYHGNPELYRQKFRLVHRTISQRAPKAAMIWCVNNIPEANIDDYYPGDDAVDWVGVNFYNVLYFDNLRSRPADHVRPEDLLQNVYSRYSGRKPIAICEYAASHQSAVDPRPRPDLAAMRLSQLYAALPRRFPRVKLIDWFDCNNMRHARPDRQLNNFSLTEDETILRAYTRAVSPDYFLSSLEDRPTESIQPLQAGDTVSGIVTVSAWVRCHLDRPRVYLLVDNQVLYAGDEPGAQWVRWDTRKASPGKHTLRLLALDADNRKLLDVKQTVIVGRKN